MMIVFYVWCAASGFLAGYLGMKSGNLWIGGASVIAIVLFNLLLGTLLSQGGLI